MNSGLFADCLCIAELAAKNAGALLAEGAFCRHEAENKSATTDLVTRFDRASEQRIVATLRQHFPNHRMLAEESGDLGGLGAKPRWLIDPLDGTTNFAHGLPLFSVSIACEWNGQVQVGVVFAPALGWMFSALRGAGAFRDGSKLHVSTTQTLAEALLATGFPYDRKTSAENNFAQFVHLKRKAQAIRRFGSAALDLSLCAAGCVDGYWEMKLKPWDIAAGLLIAEEAGAVATDFSGKPVSLSVGEVAVANPALHPQLLGALSSVAQNAASLVG